MFSGFSDRIKILLTLFSMAFLTRIFLINWYTAEYTDAYSHMTLFSNQSTYWPPLYGSLIKLFEPIFGDLERSGRFISIVAGSLCIYPVLCIGELIFSRKTGIYAACLYMFAPVVFRWNLRVMTDSLFTLFFLLSIFYFLKFYFKPDWKYILLGFFLAGLASLTRYQGFVFIPIMISMWIREIIYKRYKTALTSLWGTIPWLILAWWMYYRGFGHIIQYKQRGGLDLSSVLNYLDTGKAFIVAIPYTITYPVFGFFCYGILKAIRKKDDKILITVFFCFFILWLAAHSTYRDFQIRYFMPIIPLFLIFAGYGFTHIKIERLAFAFCVAMSIAVSGAVLYYQKDSFGDVKRAALWIKNNVKAKDTIFSDEYYKTLLWSGKKVETVHREDFQTGDYLVLHSCYTPIQNLIFFLSHKYHLKLVYETTSTIVPLLPDFSSNSTNWPEEKFKKQIFRSVIIKILGKKNK